MELVNKGKFDLFTGKTIMIFSLISPPSFLKFTFFPGMTVIKKQVFRFLRWFNRPMRDEILSFRKDYEQLVGRYEALLKQISRYMKDHSFILNEEYKNSDDVWKQLNSVDSFMLQTIRGDLELITRDCEYLLEKGEQNPVDFPYQEELLTLHITQLKELRRYSDQIDNTLKDFEKRLMRVEEVISNQMLVLYPPSF